MSRRRVVTAYNPPNTYGRTSRLMFHAVNADGGPGCRVDGGPGVDYCAKCSQEGADTETALLTQLDKMAGTR